MKLILVVVLVVVSVAHVNATHGLVCPPPEIPALQCATCFNPKQEIYKKYPLIYKLKAKFCKLCCDPIKAANPCPKVLVPPLLAAPLPPAVLPLPVPLAPLPVAPVCPPAIDPQLISTLLALSAAETPPSSCTYF